jgi:hypothetical protein
MATPRNGLDETSARARAAQDRLVRSAQIANLTSDPVAPVIEAIAEAVGAQHQISVETIQGVGEQVSSFAAQLDEVLKRAEKLAAGQLASNAAKLLPAEIDRRLVRHTAAVNRSVLIAAAIGAMAVLGLGIGFGYLAGYRHGATDATSTFTDLRALLAADVPAAAAWRDLIVQNGSGIEAELKDCKPFADPSGRTACLVALWTKPAVPVAKSEKR